MNRLRTSGANLALVALAVVAVVLSYLAVTSTSGSGADDPVAAPRPTVTTPVATATSPTAAATPTATPTPEVPDVVGRGPAAVAVAVVDETVAWRAGAQACDGSAPGVLEVSADSGATWTAVNFPLREVLAIDATGPQEALVHGLDAGCTFVSSRTIDGGATWTPVRDTGARVWTYSARDDLRAGGTPVDAPCRRVRDVAAVGRGALVLCRGGELYGTASASAPFTSVGWLPNAVALAAPDTSTVLAAVADPDCAGLRVDRSGDGGATWTAGACVEDASAAGPVGLDAVAGTAVLVSDGVQVVSAGPGASVTDLDVDPAAAVWVATD